MVEFKHQNCGINLLKKICKIQLLIGETSIHKSLNQKLTVYLKLISDALRKLHYSSSCYVLN